jgi:hypothetical protein
MCIIDITLNCSDSKVSESVITWGCGHEDEVEETIQSSVEIPFGWVTGHLRHDVKINVREVMLNGWESGWTGSCSVILNWY